MDEIWILFTARHLQTNYRHKSRDEKGVTIRYLFMFMEDKNKVYSKGERVMKIPKYIKDHIEANNRLLAEADKHDAIVVDWYTKQLKRLNINISDVPEEYLSSIKTNALENGVIHLSAIMNNLELLEREGE